MITVPSDVSNSYTNEYRHAFAIGDAQVFRLMEEYLQDPEFGFDAACVLKDIWDSEQGITKKLSSIPGWTSLR